MVSFFFSCLGSVTAVFISEQVSDILSDVCCLSELFNVIEMAGCAILYKTLESRQNSTLILN